MWAEHGVENCSRSVGSDEPVGIVVPVVIAPGARIVETHVVDGGVAKLEP